MGNPGWEFSFFFFFFCCLSRSVEKYLEKKGHEFGFNYSDATDLMRSRHHFIYQLILHGVTVKVIMESVLWF